MSPKKGKPIPAVEGFPRVSGDEPLSPSTVSARIAFSPRERG